MIEFKNYLKNNLSYVIIILILLVFFVIPIMKIWDINYLFTHDPWHHLFFSKNVEPNNFYGQYLQVADGTIKSHYPTLMRSLLYQLYLISGVELIDLYKYFGFITRFFLAIIFLLIIKTIINKKQILPFGLIILFSGSYFWVRSYITFPENFVLLFHSLAFYYGLLLLKEGQNKFFYLLSFFVSISFYYHPPSSIVPVFIYGTGLLLYFIKYKKVKIIVKNIFFTIITSLGVIFIVINEYMGQLRNNVGKTGGYGDLGRFNGPNIFSYFHYQSEILTILSILYIIFIIKNFKKINITIIFISIITLFTFILSQGTNVKLNLPIDRMQGYIILTFAVIASISFYYFFIKKNNKRILFFLFTIFFIYSFNTDIKTNSWSAIDNDLLEIKHYLIYNFNQNYKYYFDGIAYDKIQFNHPENIVLNKKNGDLLIQNKPCFESETIKKINHYFICSKIKL